MIAGIKEYIVYGWPIVFIVLLVMFWGVEYVRYRKEQRTLKHIPPAKPSELPDKLVLVRGADQLTPENRKILMLGILFVTASLLTLLVITVVNLYPDKSITELLPVMLEKIRQKPSLFVNATIVSIILLFVPLSILAMSKNERLTLSKDTITYSPPFTGILKGVVPAWELRWEEVANIRLGSLLMRDLRINMLNGNCKRIMPHVWQQPDDPLGQQNKTLFSRLKFQRDLLRNTETALRQLPLLRYIQEKRGLTIDPGKKGAFDFDLFSHSATKWTMLITFTLIFYAVFDFAGNMETYVKRPLLSWLLVPGITVMSATIIWLWSKPIPRSNTVVLGIMLGGMTVFAMYPGLLRLNQFTATAQQQEYRYRYAGDYRFIPLRETLPEIEMKKSEYWESKKLNEEYTFVLRKGGLDFYQLDMAPVYHKMRIWHCKKYAEGDKAKITQCDKTE